MGPAVGVSWYRREHYDELRRIFADGRQLPETFDQWLRAATEGLIRIEQMGAVPVKAPLDLFDFPKWCAARHLECDFRARQLFVAEFVRDHAGDERHARLDDTAAAPKPRYDAASPSADSSSPAARRNPPSRPRRLRS
jgi:hypothetical protein